MSNTKEKIIEFYKVQGAQYIENSPGSVGWSSEEAQYSRFQALYDIGATKEDIILDYGCGIGHLIDFLQNKGHNTEQTYFGIDILNEFILAANIVYPDHSFQTSDIYEVNESFDYVFGSGTFTISMLEDEMLNAIRQAYKVANKGFAFNLMHVEHKMSSNEYFKTYEPEKVLKLLQTEFKNITINDSYALKEDFTVYILK